MTYATPHSRPNATSIFSEIVDTPTAKVSITAKVDTKKINFCIVVIVIRY